jgi:hypothetical protein
MEYRWETEETPAMAIWKEGLSNAPTLKTFDICDCAGQTVVGVNARFEGWGAILQQDDKIRTSTCVAMIAGSGSKPRGDIMQRNVTVMG